jgi:hypothetical protein
MIATYYMSIITTNILLNSVIFQNICVIGFEVNYHVYKSCAPSFHKISI